MKPHIFIKYWLPVIIYCAVIFILSSMSEPPSVLPLFPYSDKLSHLLEYAILGFLLLRALVSSNKSKADFRLRTLAVALAFLYGCSDELHQYFVPERTVELLDLLTDGVGAYIGQLFFKLRG